MGFTVHDHFSSKMCLTFLDLLFPISTVFFALGSFRTSVGASGATGEAVSRLQQGTSAVGVGRVCGKWVNG